MVGVSYCWGFIVRIFEYNMTYEIHTHTQKKKNNIIVNSN